MTLLISCVALGGVAIVKAAHLKLATIEIKSLEADNAKKDGLVMRQNAAVRVWKDAGDRAAQKARAAQLQAAQVGRDYERQVRDIMSRPAPADCEQARQYGFDLAKQLVEGKQ